MMTGGLDPNVGSSNAVSRSSRAWALIFLAQQQATTPLVIGFGFSKALAVGQKTFFLGDDGASWDMYRLLQNSAGAGHGRSLQRIL